jgi:hypothetical protein
MPKPEVPVVPLLAPAITPAQLDQIVNALEMRLRSPLDQGSRNSTQREAQDRLDRGRVEREARALATNELRMSGGIATDGTSLRTSAGLTTEGSGARASGGRGHRRADSH